MALTVATGFVVDDAIVVLENTTRHLEQGMDRFKAALLGAREVGFTVLSISISLVAVFIPLLFMGGIVGRLFREFAVTLSVAVMISLVISLTTTPMMCAYLLRRTVEQRRPNRLQRFSESAFTRVLKAYERSLDWALGNKGLVLLLLVAVIGLNIYLFIIVPKGFFPQQDTGQLNGGLRADQSISFQAMQNKLKAFVNLIHKDPAVDTVVGFTGGGRAGGGFMFVNLKPVGQRKDSGQAVIARLRPQLARITGVSLFLNPVQDVRMGGRMTNSTYQYTLQSTNLADLRTWAPRLAQAMKSEPALTDIDIDQQEAGVESFVNINLDTAARMGISSRDVDNALYDSYGQRQVSTIYSELNQYHVIMEVAPAYRRTPDQLNDVYVPAGNTSQTRDTASLKATAAVLTAPIGSSAASNPATAAGLGSVATSGSVAATSTSTASTAGNAAGGSASAATSSAITTPTPAIAAAAVSAAAAPVTDVAYTPANPALRDPSTGVALSTSTEQMVPLDAIARFSTRATATSINHQNTDLATTVSYNLATGATLSDSAEAIKNAESTIGMPTTVRGSFQGTARSFQDSSNQQPILIAAALIVIYIVLGILYESYVHPITVLSTLPSAGVGAVFALLIFKMEFSIIALIGVFLLIGIVKKNAILIIDFALEAERARGLTALQAVREACLLRFRPILMTTLAAALGALPLAIGFGEGAELRQPLGVAIIGGLIASQLLTLLTTPVVYLYLDRLRRRHGDERHLTHTGGDLAPAMT